MVSGDWYWYMGSLPDNSDNKDLLDLPDTLLPVLLGGYQEPLHQLSKGAKVGDPGHDILRLFIKGNRLRRRLWLNAVQPVKEIH
jgi:hypothetical protein